MLPLQTKNKGYSFERLVMREILAACDNDTPVDRKTIVRQATEKYIQKTGNPPSNPGGYFRCLGLVLPVLRRYNPFGFGQWFQSTGLNRYLSQISGPLPDRYRITFDAILNAESQKTLLTVPDLFYEQITRVIRGTPDSLTVSDLQAARQSKATFFNVIAELDAWGGKQWHLLRSLVPIPDVAATIYKPTFRMIKRPIKDKDTATQTVAMVWLGSKRRQVKDIMSRMKIPNGGTLIEPFAGSAAISLMLKAARPDVRLWINDANNGLCAFHKTLRDNPDFMIRKLYTDLPSEKRWQEHKERVSYETGERLAWSFFYVVYYSFAQRGNNFGISSCKKELQEKKFRNSHRLLQGAKITNKDFREVMRAKGFLYLDPPYYSDENCLYHPFNDQDHFDLYNALNKRDNWLLSYHNHQTLRLYEQGQCQVESVRVRRSAGVNGTRNDSEVLISPRIP